MADPISLAVIVALLAKSAPAWLDALRGTLLTKGKEVVVEKGTRFVHNRLHLDEKEQQRHLELALKNALERGLVKFDRLEERDQYRNVLAILAEPGAHSDALRRESLRLLTLSDTPNLAELNEAYNRSLRTRSLSQPKPTSEVDATPYLSSFFEALIAELYADPFFMQQMSDVLKLRSAVSTQRSLAEVVTTLRQIGETLADHYTPEQFERDVQAYVTHIERTFRYLKIVGVVPKDRSSENKDPELNGIFVPLRITAQGIMTNIEEEQSSIVALLEASHHVVLLGGPGSGKSTVTRHLAWSHALANLPTSTTSLSNTPLLSGKPLPLRIELRRLTEDRKHHPDYNFLSYATEVLLGREGVEIDPRMFKELLERKTMLLLFDGLDEVATLDERQRLVEEIEHFALYYPGNRILVTSRPIGYRLAPFSNKWFSEAQVQDFNDEQIRQFLDRWYSHVLRLSPIPREDQQELETLFTALKENARLHKLAENPLLLTVITALHRYERLPDRRVLVYDRCADLLLETWAKLKGTNVRWQGMKMVKEDQYACVAHLGFVLHMRSQKQESGGAETPEDIASDVPTRFMLREIENFLNSRKLIAEVAEQRAEAKRFLELMQIEAGLIVERGSDENGESLYGFVHRTFQEYFAAADVYERYQQEEDPMIISEFLQEHLHDPHWREVILLLLGKLKRKPITVQLRQILEGKIKSRRSKYTDVVQQDLFFVCDCLIEEIAVENEMAGLVISNLSNMIRISPISLQKKEALEYLGKLMQMRQYASLVRGELVALVRQNLITDIRTTIAIAQTLFQNSPEASEEQQLATKTLLHLAQRADQAVEHSIYAAKVLYRCTSKASKERQATFQLLLNLAQRPNFPVEQAIHTISELCWHYFQAPEERHAAFQLLLDFAQRPDLPVEQIVQAAWTLYGHSPATSKEEQLSLQVLLNLAQRLDLSVEQIIEGAETLDALYWSSPVSGQQYLASEMLLHLAQRPNLSFEQRVQVLDACYRCSRPSSKKGLQAFQMLLSLAEYPNLSFEQIIQVANSLYGCSSSEEERQQAFQMLLSLAEYPNLSFEQIIQVANSLFLKSYKRPDIEQQASQLLLHLAQSPGLSFEQQMEVAETLYQCSPSSMEIQKQATHMLLRLAQQTDLSVKQAIYVVQALYQSSPDESEERKQAIHMLMHLVGRPDLPFEQAIHVILAFYQDSHPKSSDRRQNAGVLWQLGQKQDISDYQRLQVATIPLTVKRANYIDRLRAVKMVLSLLQGDEARYYLERYWSSMNLVTRGPSGTLSIDISNEPESKDIPYIAELAGQEMLPFEARDEMYQILRSMVPQFDKIPASNEQSTS